MEFKQLYHKLAHTVTYKRETYRMTGMSDQWSYTIGRLGGFESYSEIRDS